VIASCHLNPLNEVETREYIEHRLRLVGWQGNKPRFGAESYAGVYRHTQGVPRRVNVFCDRLLLYGFLEELYEFSAETVEAVGRELTQDEPSGPRAGGRSLLRVSHALEERLAELEQAVEALLQNPEWQDVQLERLTRRVQQMEPVVQRLQKETIDLDRRLDDRLLAETGAEEPSRS